MSTQIQRRRGTTTEHNTFTGVEGELTVDTTKDTVVVHDGATTGGRPLLREDQANLPTSVTNGISVPSANNVAISTNGTGRLFVDANGVVDIYNSTPKLGFSSVGSFYNWIECGGVAGDNYMRFATANTERLRITSDGKLGLGTSTPSESLHVNGNARANHFLSQGYFAGQGSLSTADARSGLTGIGPSSVSSPGAFYGANAFFYGATHSTRPGDIELGTGQNTAGTIQFKINNNERLRIDSSGRLLVGTSSSSLATKIHVQGSTSPTNATVYDGTVVVTDGAVDQVALYLHNSSALGTANGTVGIKFAPGGNGHYNSQIIAGRDADFSHSTTNKTNLRFFTAGGGGSSSTERLRIDSQGRVGIGTTAPSEALTVSGNIRANGSNARIGAYGTNSSSPQIALGNSAGTAHYLFYETIDGSGNRGSLNIFDNVASSSRLVIDTSGRVLVGTSSTSAATGLVVQGNSAGGSQPGFVTIAWDENTLSSGSALGVLAFADSGHTSAATVVARRDGGTWTSGSSQPTALTFSTTADGASSPTERMRIDNLGNTTNFASGIFGLTTKTSLAAGTTNALLAGAHSATSTITGTVSFKVYTNGNIVNTNNSYGSLSDIKLKENIVDANSQWDDLKDLRVVNYNFKPETGSETFKQLGLIAQEVETVCPGLVGESPDRDAEGNDLGTTTKSVNYSVLYMKAVKALQEAIERIETLEQRLNDAGIA